ncbi:MAG: thioesterase domain-containing protein [Flavobacteriales bacterium]|jgi:thioesterase domain-containing protein
MSIPAKGSDQAAEKSQLESQLIELFDQKFGMSVTDIDAQLSFPLKINVSKLNDVINHTFDIVLDDKLLHKKPISKVAEIVLKAKKKCKHMVMPLNSTKDKPSFYFICGIALYGPLAKNLANDFCCYGIFIPQEEIFFKNAGRNSAYTIPYLASLYVDAILNHASGNANSGNTAPPTLAIGGVSFGGVLAFEIARQLKAKGCEVLGLAILDAVLPGALTRSCYSACRSKMSHLMEPIKAWLAPKSDVLAAPSSKVPPREKQKKHLLHIFRGKVTRAYFDSDPIYSGPTLVVRAADQSNFNVEPSLCWSPKLKGPIIIGEASGAHLEILQSLDTANLIISYIKPNFWTKNTE